jgi:hypothetical protein
MRATERVNKDENILFNLILIIMQSNYYDNFFNGHLPDTRIEKRANKVITDMLTFGNAVVNRFCLTNTDKIGAYRMFSNSSFSHENLLEGIITSCKNNQGSAHLLCIQDTTELNFTHHLGRIGKEDPDIGPITKNDNGGFFCHPVLVIDANKSIPIGISYAKLWNRKWDKLDKYERCYTDQDIEDKESYRWIEAAIKTKAVLSSTPVLTVIGDRESDIYEELVVVPQNGTDLLIRSCTNRILGGSDLNLYEFLDIQEKKDEYEIEVKGNKKRKDRTAKISLKYTEVSIKKPKNKKLKGYPSAIKVWAIEAKEMQETVPEGEAPIHWRLLTTHEINEVEDAFNCIKWYASRWLIEELFRVLKSQGLEICSSQMETGAALKKLTIMALQVSLTTMTLKLSIDKPQNLEAGIVFSKQQIEFIKLIMGKVQGKTHKQQNPYYLETLEWCSWGIARLSGWSGYKSHGPPGYISIKRGLDIFYNKYEGYLTALEMLNDKKDVYKE